jgi:hypothetical protein
MRDHENHGLLYFLTIKFKIQKEEFIMVNYYETRYKNKKESISNVDLLLGLFGAVGVYKILNDISNDVYRRSGMLGKLAIIVSMAELSIASFGIISSTNSITTSVIEKALRKTFSVEDESNSNVIPFNKEGE